MAQFEIPERQVRRMVNAEPAASKLPPEDALLYYHT